MVVVASAVTDRGLDTGTGTLTTLTVVETTTPVVHRARVRIRRRRCQTPIRLASPRSASGIRLGLEARRGRVKGVRVWVLRVLLVHRRRGCSLLVSYSLFISFSFFSLLLVGLSDGWTDNDGIYYTSRMMRCVIMGKKQ